jgi:hypothetical protein
MSLLNREIILTSITLLGAAGAIFYVSKIVKLTFIDCYTDIIYEFSRIYAFQGVEYYNERF